MPSPVTAPHHDLPERCGIGLKAQHHAALLADAERGDGPAWVEVHPQNYFHDGGPAHRWLGAIAAQMPVGFHSVALSLGSADGLNGDQLDRLAALSERYRPACVSDHLSWSGNAHDRVPELLPLPYTRQALDHVAAQVERVQERLGRTMLIENPSRMLSFAADAMPEVDFLHQLCARTGCGLLLDINNVEVSAVNTGFDAAAYLERIDPALVGEVHLAGHSTQRHPGGPLKIDDHGSAVSESCWALYRRFIARAGLKPTLIEWDNDVPDYPVLAAEAAKADAILSEAQSEAHALAG